MERKKGYHLKKILGVGFGIAVLIGGTIGVGILRAPGTIAALLNEYWMILSVWVFGGLYVLMGANSVAELATMMPKAGGAYYYVQSAFGRYAGFVTGWFDYLTYAIAPAYFCIAIAEYLALLLPLLNGHETLLALLFLVSLVLLHLGGTHTGSVLQKWTSVIKVIFFVALILSCFLFHGTTPAFNIPTKAAEAGVLLLFAQSLQLVFGTYNGWMSVCYFAEEDKAPSKNIPRSLFTGAIIVMLIYVLINAAFLYVLPPKDLANSPLVASKVAGVVFGAKGATLVILIAVFSLVSILNAHMMIPARILFGLSRDGHFIQKGTYINKGGTPVTALLFSSLISVVLILSGSFNQLFSLGAFMAVMVMGCTFASLIRLRIKQPLAARPYRAKGYPWTTLLMCCISLALLVAFAISDRQNMMVILGVLLLSYPAYAVMKKFRRQ